MGDLSIFPEDYFYFNGPFSGPATLRLTNDGSEPLAIKVQTLRVALKVNTQRLFKIWRQWVEL